MTASRKRIAPRHTQEYLRSGSEAETEAIAARFAQTLRGSDVVLLDGDLGAGKTVFVRGLARAMGIRDRITSPTFVLLRSYKTKQDTENKERRTRNQNREAGSPLVSAPVLRFLVHLDAYRIHDPRELLAIGLDEWLDRSDAIVVIEWGGRVRPLLPASRILRVRITAVRRSLTHRRITITAASL